MVDRRRRRCSRCCSFAGYIVLFRTVFVKRPHPHSHLERIDWRESYEITMAGLAATRLFAAAGAGGVALTAWALRRSGMEPRLVACRLVAFIVILYTVYAGSMLIDGLGLGVGLFPGGGSFALTFVPAIVAAAAVLGRRRDRDAARRHRAALRRARRGRRAARRASTRARPPCPRWWRAACAPRSTSCVRKDPGVLGALAWWGFDISVLWAMFHAFGSPPPFTVIWMAYFVGMLGNLLPLPGGIGGVEGGMIGAFAAFGVNLELATLAVLSYRAISFWLPTDPRRDRLLPAAPHGRSLARSGARAKMRSRRSRPPGRRPRPCSVGPQPLAGLPFCRGRVIHYTK